MSDQTRRHQLMVQLAEVREKLAAFGIQDSSDYAEALVADALGGDRVSSGVNQGFDVVAPRYGRVEVKCRRLPEDGRIEERVDLKSSKACGFDFLAIVIFEPNYEIKGAVLVPYDEVWPIVESQSYRRISYSDALQLPGHVDLTRDLRHIIRRL